MLATLNDDFTSEKVILAVSLELSNKSWKLGLSDGRRDKPSVITVSDEQAQARLLAVVKVIEETRMKWQLPNDVKVVVMHEAGQDGFWICRALSEMGYPCLVIDPASIPVGRQARRAKTDRLDAIMLVNSLRAWLRGERDRMRVLHVPDELAEEERQLVRDRGVLQKEIGQHHDRMRKLLRTVGCWDEVEHHLAQRLQAGEIRCHDGRALPKELLARLLRECERLAQVEEQFKALTKTQVAQLSEAVQEKVATFAKLKAIGDIGAIRITTELFWRRFDNQKQVGSCVGLVPQPYDSGDTRIDQGISKQGNRRVRSLLIEMAWMWLRYQPESKISLWFAQKTHSQTPNKRGRRVAIVAVARRLAIALWRYIEYGVIPEGAQFKEVKSGG
ncbi:MAG: IS110 family transposase [Aquabacterium sp.]|uniref:IS110 family transposase n=1 Tax=Aquabacterium sp. TaxID=1872578 RepID=UPI00120D6ED2|nr:IS110 family transposase [Aquabacterium sp.]TAK83253.1 MAG: IS110 family transposase [Aquabacterium sp.]